MLIRAAATLAGTLLIGLPAFAQELIVEQQVERVIVLEFQSRSRPAQTHGR